MPFFHPLSSHAPLYAAVFVLGVAIVLARRLPVVGRLISLTLTLGAVALAVLVFEQRAEFDPSFARIAQFLKLGENQQVAGGEMRVPMARDGHFWLRVRIGHVEQRMLVDSGATITALSAETARAAGVHVQPALFPMLIRTANGSVEAETGKVRVLRIGNIVARDVPVVVSPAFGDMNVIGMNFLSRLKSWRVEGQTMILTPHHPQTTA
jgi:aspartyl protease family protein